jgi:lipopolysaccharide/colanic/teichoic acid biosynthesis glycosyltransferase
MNKNGHTQPSLPLADRSKVRIPNPFMTRIRFQLGGGLFLAVIVPAMYRYQSLFDFVQFDNAVKTMIGATLSITIGYFIIRRLSKFPGDSTRSHILLIYSVTFGVTMSIFFMTRLDYSRFLFLSSFVVCLIWFSAVHFAVLRSIKTKLAIVPGGNTDKLLELDNVSWTILDSTKAYESEQGAIVADLRYDLPAEWERFIAEKALQGISVFHSKQVQEMLTGKVDIEHLSENNFGSLLPQMDYLRFRQAIDFVATIILSPILLLIMTVVGMIILATSGRPVFFGQDRVGYRGALFTAYKFRTMANPVADDSGSGDINSVDNKINLAMTDKDDKRITQFGAILRKYRIDELPQALNILKGQMSWIGPRPEALALSQWYQEKLPFYSYRHVVKPGITGWAQINQGHVIHSDQVLEKLHYDFFYIKHLSAWLDFLIMWRTVKVVLFGIGAK